MQGHLIVPNSFMRRRGMFSLPKSNNSRSGYALEVTLLPEADASAPGGQTIIPLHVRFFPWSITALSARACNATRRAMAVLTISLVSAVAAVLTHLSALAQCTTNE